MLLFTCAHSHLHVAGAIVRNLFSGVFLLPYVPSNHFYCSGLVSPHLLSPGLLTVSERGLSLYKCGLPCLVWLVSFTGASKRMVLVSFSFSL